MTKELNIGQEFTYRKWELILNERDTNFEDILNMLLQLRKECFIMANFIKSGSFDLLAQLSPEQEFRIQQLRLQSQSLPKKDLIQTTLATLKENLHTKNNFIEATKYPV